MISHAERKRSETRAGPGSESGAPGRHSAPLNARPAVQRVAALSRLMNGRGRRAEPVVQLYAETDQGKLSETSIILLAGPQELYATGAKILEAESRQDDVMFGPGDAHPVYTSLLKVKPAVRPGSELDNQISAMMPKGASNEASASSASASSSSAASESNSADKITALRRAMEAKSLLARAEHFFQQEKIREYMELKRKNDQPDSVSESKSDDDSSDGETELLEDATIHAYKEWDGLTKEQKEALTESDALAPQREYIVKDRTAGDDVLLLPADCGDASRYVGGIKTRTYTPDLAELEETQWAAHHAAIIMQDGGDEASLENAAARQRDNFSKMDFDRGWSFHMYGTAAEQTFGKAYEADFPGEPTITVAARSGR